MLHEILVNIISDFLFLAITVGLGWVFFIRTRSSQLFKFFGIEDKSRRIAVYLSNHVSQLDGVTGMEAIALYEMQVATRFGDLFNFPLRSLSAGPGVLSRLLVSNVQVKLLPSPLESPLSEEQIERSSSFITLGSPAYNSVSALVESVLHPQACFSITEDGSAILVEGIPPITDQTYGFVERIVDYKKERCIFYIAGLKALGTAGAANFLIEEWWRLRQKPGNFLVMLHFDPENYKNWSIAFER